MKKLGAILTSAALLITLGTSFCFAGSGLTIEKTYPKDGSAGASIENLGVKIYFSEDLTEKSVGEANKGAFQLYDSKGKKLPTRVLYNDKEKGVVLVLLNNKKGEIKAESNSEYTLKISGDLVDDKGNTLGKDTEISFKTLNQTTNTMISLGMMVVMFGGMIIITTRSAKKATEEKRKEEKVNPYKEAKKTGKSVEEIVEKEQKKKAKAAREAAKAEERKAKEHEDDEEEINKYKVNRRHSASEAKSKYVAAKKAAAEKAKAQGSKNASKKKKKK